MRRFVVASCGLMLCVLLASAARAEDAAKNRLFEMRTYVANDGKMEDLHKRFRDHTCKLFEKHGMTNLGYWVPEGPDDGEPRLVYILAHKNRAAASDSWKAFRADPDWIAAKTASEKDGPLLAKPPESVFLKPTDYSKIK